MLTLFVGENDHESLDQGVSEMRVNEIMVIGTNVSHAYLLYLLCVLVLGERWWLRLWTLWLRALGWRLLSQRLFNDELFRRAARHKRLLVPFGGLWTRRWIYFRLLLGFRDGWRHQFSCIHHWGLSIWLGLTIVLYALCLGILSLALALFNNGKLLWHLYT